MLKIESEIDTVITVRHNGAVRFEVAAILMYVTQRMLIINLLK